MRYTFTLANGAEIPAVGYGTFKVKEGNPEEIILNALNCGYRHLDTAKDYGNEEAVGKALRKSGLDRSEVFITSKLWRDNQGYEETFQEFEASCQRLGVEYLDLYLIHWPTTSDLTGNWRELNVASWKAMEELYRSGKVRAIGVSNFLPHHLNNLMDRTGIIPLVNQLEFHPGYMQKAAVDYSQRLGIQVEGWAPLGRSMVLEDPLLLELASKYEKTTAQLCVRFCLQCGVLPLPKSANAQRMEANKDVFGFEIEEEDMHRLMSLPQVGWSGIHPDRPKVGVKR